MNNQKILKTDVLVLGTGIAGCVAALKLAENKKIKILLVTKDKDIKQSSTLYAQGGIIARSPHDSKEKLKIESREGSGKNVEGLRKKSIGYLFPNKNSRYVIWRVFY